VERLLDALLGAGAVSAAVALAGDRQGILWSRAAGWARRPPPAPAAGGTWFDFGSLTKPFVATLALTLDRTGELPLSLPVGEILPGAARALAGVPLAELLRHRAGFQAWTPLYARCHSLAEVEELLASGELLGARAGTYSDLDYLLWGLAAERALGRPLAALVAERVLAPLGLGGAAAAAPGDRPEVAESLMDTGREVELAAGAGLPIAPLPAPAPGWPQDGNARFLVGLAAAGGAGGGSTAAPAPPGSGRLLGHAGLFGSAAALWRLGAEWLAPGRLLHEESVARALAGSGPFALGWWRRRHRGSGGPALSPSAFGHSGFAGGSLWIDPACGRVLVLLAHRTGPAVNMNRWRRRFHAAALRGGFDEPEEAQRG
jgi:CubicO group peptidase (beta-lactamase class C family)